MKKYDAEKDYQKRVKRLYRKAKIKDGDIQDQINAKILDYFKNGRWDLKVGLPKDLRTDPMFLLSLFKAAPRTIYIYAPRKEDKELLTNVSFMTEYVKLRVLRDTELYYSMHIDSLLRSAFVTYRDAVMIPEFVVKIAEEFPNADVVAAIKDAVITHRYYMDKKEEKQHYEEYKALLNSLPKELLIREVSKFGEKALSKLPSSLPYYTELISAGIEKDGFVSLNRLDVDQILDNKDLIIKAYEKEGGQALRNYIVNTLSPNRERYYICHEEPHFYTAFSEKHKNVQEALAKDPEIVEILKKEQYAERVRTLEKMTNDINDNAEVENE